MRFLKVALIVSLFVVGASQSASAETKTLLGNFKTTYYWVAKESQYPGPKTVTLYDNRGRSLGKFSHRFVKALNLEGTAATNDGRILNVWNKVRGTWRYVDVSTRAPHGIGSKNNPLIPFRSVASDPRVVPHGTILYIPKAKGAKLPNGTIHDGYFIAADVGGGIKGRHLDLFTGLGDQRSVLTSMGVFNLRAHPVYKVSSGPRRPYLTQPSASAPSTPTTPTTPSTPTTPTPDTESSQGYGKVTASTLNVRSGPGTGYRVLGTLKKNAGVTIFQRKGAWVQVPFKDGKGWVHSSYIEASASPVTRWESVQPSREKKGSITASSLNVRKNPNTRAKILTTIKRNEKVTILDQSRGWYYIRHARGQGWVYGRYVKPLESSVVSEGATGALRGLGQ